MPQGVPAPSIALGTLVGFSVEFGAPLLHLTAVGVRVDISPCVSHPSPPGS